MADKQSRAAIGDLRVKVDVDISDALTGLKALQREARKATQALRELEEVADGRSVGDVEALNVNSNSLADYSTAELTNELTKREGVDEYFVDPHEGKAFISVYNGEKSEQITVDGPARILINRD